MPKFTFQDSDNKINEVIPNGIYGFKVLRAENCLVEKGQNSGKPMIKMTVRVYSSKGEDLTDIYETLVFQVENVGWKIDTFLKCANFSNGQISKGEDVDVEPETIVGLKGYCKVGTRTYDKSTGERDQTTGKFLTVPTKINQVASWLTDQRKLERDQSMIPRSKPEAPAPAPEPQYTPAPPQQAPAQAELAGDQDCPF